MKAARVSGEILGKYHPHSDQTIYETLVRMAQDFVMRYPFVDGHGNFGSLDGDPPAAPRYTELRMTPIAMEMLADIDKDTVDFKPNYDETLEVPIVLPNRVPALLLNGSYGIAVAMATNIPPHNLTEVVNACLALVEDPDLPNASLLEYVLGPDFPTGGYINGEAGIRQAYLTGKGNIVMRAKAEIIETERRETIIVNEIPFLVNKSHLIEGIAKLYRNKELDGISDLRDESDENVRIVIEVKRDANAQLVLNHLYAKSQLQRSFAYNAVALVHGQPTTLTLKAMLESFLEHRREVIMRRTSYLLRQARRRGHLLEGNAVALNNIDEIVELIKSSADRRTAFEALLGLHEPETFHGWEAKNVVSLLNTADRDLVRPEELAPEYGFREFDNGEVRYFLSEEQSNAILDLQLHRLTGLERERLRTDYQKVIEDIREYLDILGSQERVQGIVRDELKEIKEKYGDERHTDIRPDEDEILPIDLVEKRDVVLIVSRQGYVKMVDVAEFSSQGRGGVGRKSGELKDGDFVEHLIPVNTHDTVLCFTNLGRVYWLDVYRLRASGLQGRGRAIVNYLGDLHEDEHVVYYLPVDEYSENEFLLFATEKGKVIRLRLSAFSNRWRRGINAVTLTEGDRLLSVEITDGTQDIVLIQSSGKLVRFKESDVRVTGRGGQGVRGIRLNTGAHVISLIVPREDTNLLLLSEKGIGKQTLLSNFSVKNRAIQGSLCIRLNERSGDLVAAFPIQDDDDIMAITDAGTVIRSPASQVSVLGVYATGVRVMRLRGDERVVSAMRTISDL